jgi:hypothetical protein
VPYYLVIGFIASTRTVASAGETDWDLACPQFPETSGNKPIYCCRVIGTILQKKKYIKLRRLVELS